ncbi:hypothetical protein ACU8V7_06530 [Zobellia nedashkovskayae]
MKTLESTQVVKEREIKKNTSGIQLPNTLVKRADLLTERVITICRITIYISHVHSTKLNDQIKKSNRKLPNQNTLR